jgi:predicted Zn-dependent peptidase
VIHPFRLQAVLALLVLLLPAARAALPVQEHILSNGMRFLIVEDHSAPSFMGAWVAKVGAVNEPGGQSGLTHLLEHMMFKGSRTIGTRDLDRDLELMAQQELLKARMREITEELRWQVRRGELESLPAAQKAHPEFQGLMEEFHLLVEAQRENMIPNEFDQILKRNGELFGNAFTSKDMTAYFTVLPANRLELWFWMESDRLLNPVFREYYAERDVVREERRMMVEADPTGIHSEAVDAMLWQAHPYRWPVIGWESDVEELTMTQAEAYFHTYYGPGNVSALLVGAVDGARVVELAERYFGRLEPRQAPPALVTLEPEPRGVKRYIGEAETNPTVVLLATVGGFGHAQSGAWQMMASLLSGDTGRLQRRLVQEQGLAVNAWAYYNRMKYGGEFHLQAEAAEGVPLEALEAALVAELERLASEPVPGRELQKVKNNFLVGAYREEQNPIRAGFSLLMSEGMGDWREAEAFRERILAVDAAAVAQAAAPVADPERRLTVWYTRAEGATASSEPAGLAELPAEMQQMARGFLAQLKTIRDPAALSGILARMEGLPADLPAESVKLNALLKEAVHARMAELAAEEESR